MPYKLATLLFPNLQTYGQTQELSTYLWNQELNQTFACCIHTTVHCCYLETS